MRSFNLFKGNSSTCFLQGSEVLGPSCPSRHLQNNGFTSLHCQLFPKRFQYQHISNVMSHKTLNKIKRVVSSLAICRSKAQEGETQARSVPHCHSGSHIRTVPPSPHPQPLPSAYTVLYNWSSCCHKGLEKKD